VRYFIILMLGITHAFVGAGVLVGANSTEPLWSVMWPDPMVNTQMTYTIDTLTLTFMQRTAAWLMKFWIYLVIAMLAAFAVSFFFSANTIIYVLMRKEVDATEIDDVYLEQIEDEFADASEPSAATSATGESPAPMQNADPGAPPNA
jgi:hypothetical protein